MHQKWLMQVKSNWETWGIETNAVRKDWSDNATIDYTAVSLYALEIKDIYDLHFKDLCHVLYFCTISRNI